MHLFTKMYSSVWNEMIYGTFAQSSLVNDLYEQRKKKLILHEAY